MPLEILTFPQLSNEWWEARCGLVTASHFCDLLRGPRGGEAKGRKTYLQRLAAERHIGAPLEAYTNGHLERGKLMEADARDEYAFLTDNDCEAVGFIRDRAKGAGCSPDSLIRDDGALEIKTCFPHQGLIDSLFSDEPPEKFVAQCQGVLWVCERAWCDLVIYWPQMPVFVARLDRDEAYIARIAAAVAQANEEIELMVERLRRRGDPNVLREQLEKSVAALPPEPAPEPPPQPKAAPAAAPAPDPLDIPEFLRRVRV